MKTVYVETIAAPTAGAARKVATGKSTKARIYLVCRTIAAPAGKYALCYFDVATVTKAEMESHAMANLVIEAQREGRKLAGWAKVSERSAERSENKRKAGAFDSLFGPDVAAAILSEPDAAKQQAIITKALAAVKA